jgi:hypothetical protein
MSRSRPLLFAAALVPVLALAVLVPGCPRRPPAVPQTPGEFLGALERLGLAYESRPVGMSLVLRRRGGRPWPEDLDNFAMTPRNLRGLVFVIPLGGETLATGSDDQEGQLQLGRLFLRGDPEELRRIAEALR